MQATTWLVFEGGHLNSPSIKLRGATLIGLGAIVGGGILALAGVALQQAGPAAIVAFSLNGVLAIITALSFSELASAAPESGGAYTFARRVLSIRAGFGVGWILWSAYLVAAVLYALGFAAFALACIDAWFGTVLVNSRGAALVLALGATAAYCAALIQGSGGGGQWATIGKIVLFTLLVVVGLVMIPSSPVGTVTRGFTPFAPSGLGGILTAMGSTFIALQGFDLIGAVAGDVDRPAYTIPRAMLISLGVALLIYIPLLVVVFTVGDPGGDIIALATAHPETLVATAARNFLGEFGFNLVLVAGVLSMLSALVANLMAASHVASAMASDRVLPAVLAQEPDAPAPVMATYATGVAVAAFIVMVPDVATAGSAASVIFLIVFALVHMKLVLFRQRGGDAPFKVPGYPLVPALAGLVCAALAVWQSFQAPEAAMVVIIWTALGALLYRALFAGRAEPLDAMEEARAPELLKSRGRSPLVLAPVANPENAPGIISMAHALAPSGFGRVLLLTVVRPNRDDPESGLASAEAVLHGALRWALSAHQAPEALLTVAESPWVEIARVARSRSCEALMLGMSELDEAIHGGALEHLLHDVGDADVGLLRAPPNWRLENVKRVLIPLGGRGRHDALRARLIGSLLRTGDRTLVFLRCIQPSADANEESQARRSLRRATDGLPKAESILVKTDDVVATLMEHASKCDLVLLGLQRQGRRRLFGEVALRIAEKSGTATLMLARRES